MIKKTKEEKEELETSQAIPEKETSKGREEDYFFPNERITIKASSLSEAKEKLKKLKNNG